MTQSPPTAPKSATTAARPETALRLVLTWPIAGYLVGARSDRTGSRLGLFRLCAVAGFAGWTAIAFSTQLWMPFVVAATAGPRAMLFATAVCTLLQVLPLGKLRDPGAAALTDGPHAAHIKRPGVRAMAPLLAFTGLYAENRSLSFFCHHSYREVTPKP